MPKRPPCPGYPENYVWVESRERPHWRRKRRSTRLNAGYQESSDRTRIVSPAARRVRRAIEPYLNGITIGRLHNRIGNAFRKSLKEKGRLVLCYLKDVEMQRDYPLDAMLHCHYGVYSDGKNVVIELPIERGNVRVLNTLVTHYYFEAVLLYGNASIERGLQAEHAISSLYSIGTDTKSRCVLTLRLPENEDWCLFLKMSCLEGNELAAHTKHHRMKVVAVCNDSEMQVE